MDDKLKHMYINVNTRIHKHTWTFACEQVSWALKTTKSTVLLNLEYLATSRTSIEQLGLQVCIAIASQYLPLLRLDQLLLSFYHYLPSLLVITNYWKIQLYFVSSHLSGKPMLQNGATEADETSFDIQVMPNFADTVRCIAVLNNADQLSYSQVHLPPPITLTTLMTLVSVINLRKTMQ